MDYNNRYLDWKINPEKYWKECASNIDWFKEWDTVLEKKSDSSYKWFSGGELNTCYNCLDRHIKKGLKEKISIIYDSPITGVKQFISYESLYKKVNEFAAGLIDLGVAKGDRVIIYLPMIPQVVIAMLGCARIGAIHSVVFGGFASKELANRIEDAKPKLIISSSCGIEPNKIINYKMIIDEALAISSHKPLNQVFYQRKQLICNLDKPGDMDWQDFIQKEKIVNCVSVKSNDPLYILYTSGTTGIPKGIVRTNGGHAVALYNSMLMTYGVKESSVFWAASDVGWVVGHSYIVYAPLLLGCSTVLYEGKPVGTPDAGQFWRVIEDYNVSCMFTAPTALRAIKKEDPSGKEIKKYNLKSLNSVFLAGERADPESIKWAMEKLNVPVIDHWWQTETGWSIAGNFFKFGLFPIKYGSTGKAAPGFEVKTLNDEGNILENEKMGNLVIKLPLPPGCSDTIWNDDKRFFQAYLKRFKGYYDTSDAGIIDKDNYISVMSRTDDIINCAGHRLSTGAIEEILTSHKDVAECAVVGIRDKIKGEVPLGLLVINDDNANDSETIIKETISLVREKLGPVASYKKSFIVENLPTTRSGKILRSTISKILREEGRYVSAFHTPPPLMGHRFAHWRSAQERHARGAGPAASS